MVVVVVVVVDRICLCDLSSGRLIFISVTAVTEEAHSGPKLQSDRETLIFASTWRQCNVPPLRFTRRKFRQGLGRSHPELVNDDTLHELHMHNAGETL